MDNLIGQNLGRYHIIEPLGQGGMATVYKAFDTSLERNVAIKIIRTDKKEGTEQNEFLKRFQREAKALAQLDHPYILKVLDYGEQEGIPYLVMPFIQGGTLKEKMGQPMPYREAAALLMPIAQALDYAHKRKIIHRDVKPANILISESNSPLLSDFGIAKIIESGDSTQLTAAGVGIGTPDYMAPEQWAGQTDPRTDIYSLGIVFFQMITGRLPFSADTPAAVLIKHIQDPLPRPTSYVPNLPEEVERVLFKALSKEPEGRFLDMGGFADSLGKLTLVDQSSLETVSQAMQTIQANAPRTGAHRLDETVLQNAATPENKKSSKLTMSLIVASLVVVVICLILLAGGGFLASRMASNPKLNSATPGVGENTEGISPLPQTTSLQPLQTQSNLPQSSFTATPIESIPGFPDDVPFLAITNGDLLKSVSQGMTIYQFSTNMPFTEVVDFYKSGMSSNGWEIMSETTQGEMYMWTFTKGDNRTVMINIISQSGAGVMVNIMFQ